MAFIIKDRVKENTTTTGTGAVSLGGAAATFDTFQSYMSNGDTTYYAIVHTTSGTDEWEVGLGTWNTGNTLTRTTVLAGSSGTSAVNFSSGTKDVFMTYPASKAAVAGEDVTFADITVTGTVDGRDVAADGTKLDGIDTSADVTDATTVAAAGALMKSGGTMTGNLILNADPTTALGAATKEYVDTIASAGIHYHDPVRVEAPSALTVTYDNGSSGVGATLTNAGTQEAITIDGVALSLNDRVLIYNQTDQTQNGVYTVTTVGSASTNWVLTRSTDTDSYGASDPDSFGKGDAFFVKEGNTGAGELYVMTTAGTITFGTTNIVFSQVAETAVYSAGTGLTLTGTTFSIGQDVATSANVTFNQVTAAIIGNVTGNLTGDVTGNADTATALETARTIQLSGDVTGSASFDGSANINITAAVQDDSHAHVISNVDGLQTALDGKVPTTRTITSGNYLTGGGNLTANRTLDVDATSSNTASKVVARDSSGDFSAGTITAALSGNASTATALATARTISLTGDVSGSTSFDGSGNVSITATVADDSHNHTTSNIDNFTESVQDIVGGMVSGNTESGISVTYDDAGNSLDFNVNDPTISLTGAVTGSATMTNLGNVSIATTATSDPTLTLSGDASGSATFTNLGNATLSVSLATDSVAANEIAANAVGASELNVSGNGTTSQFLRSDGDGTFTWATPTDTNTTYSAGSGLSLSGTTFSHTDTSSQSSVNNSGRTYIQDITLDTYGHVTGISSATETVTNTDTTYSAGSGLSLSGTTFSHSDTSSASSVNNSGNTFIQDITVDTYGHITAISSGSASFTASVPSGSVMIFAQTSAPSGWTKSTTHNNKALRVVSGTASSGGNQAFTTAFASRTTSSTTAGGSISNTTAGGTVGSTTLSTSEMPSHNHQAATYTTVVGWSGNSPGRVFSNNLNYNGGGSVNTGSTGGSGSHNHSFSGSAHNHTFTGSSHSHTLNMAVQYVDVILASKD